MRRRILGDAVHPGLVGVVDTRFRNPRGKVIPRSSKPSLAARSEVVGTSRKDRAEDEEREEGNSRFDSNDSGMGLIAKEEISLEHMATITKAVHQRIMEEQHMVVARMFNATVGCPPWCEYIDLTKPRPRQRESSICWHRLLRLQVTSWISFNRADWWIRNEGRTEMTADKLASSGRHPTTV